MQGEKEKKRADDWLSTRFFYPHILSKVMMTCWIGEIIRWVGGVEQADSRRVKLHLCAGAFVYVQVAINVQSPI